ncbi:MAG: SDR family oxidoreductase [Burkholderiales bacterium]|nr:SDR family oxidoreductase [Burkholderiales bacterium]
MPSPELFDVSEEVAIVTGVSGQLGAQYANAFLEAGARVAGLDLKPSAACEHLLATHTQRFLFVTADVTDRASLQAALRALQGRFGSPTVLVNNAAIDAPPSAPLSENGPYEHYPDASWDRIMDVNVKGVHLCCQVFGQVMAESGGGSIINIASIYGMVAPDQSLYDYRRQRGETFFKPVAYSVSKSALLNLTRYLAVYWAKAGVRVNTLTIAGVFNNQEQAFLDAYCGRIPVGRMAEPDAYNGAILFLASRASRYMTGGNLVVDGGWTAI